MIVHGNGTFDSRGVRIFERWWRPESAPRCVIALVHGYAEHSGRYEHVGAWFAERGIAVEALDLRGHGHSEGARALVGSFNEFLNDVSTFLGRVKGRNPGVPMFLLGHSMGGAITVLFAIVRKPDVNGVILSGPALTNSGRRRMIGRIVAPLGKLVPGMTLAKLPADTVSRDPAVVADYENDPLNYRGGFKLGLLGAAGRASARITRDMEAFALPLLIVHGSEDALVPVDGSEELIRRASSADKTIKIYEGLFHEVLNEPEKEEVMADVLEWMEARLPALTPDPSPDFAGEGSQATGSDG